MSEIRLNPESSSYLASVPETYQLLSEENRISLPRTGNYLVPCQYCVFQWAYLDNLFRDLLSREEKDFLLDGNIWLNLPGVQDFRSRQVRVIWNKDEHWGRAELFTFHDHRWDSNWLRSLSLRHSLEGAVTAMYLSWGLEYHLGYWHGCYGIDNTPIFSESFEDPGELIKTLIDHYGVLENENPVSYLYGTKIPFGLRIECNGEELIVRILSDSPTAGTVELYVKVISGQISERKAIDLFKGDGGTIY